MDLFFFQLHSHFAGVTLTSCSVCSKQDIGKGGQVNLCPSGNPVAPEHPSGSVVLHALWLVQGKQKILIVLPHTSDVPYV